MTAVENYINFFNREMKCEIGEPSLISVIGMFSLQQMYFRQLIRSNNISSKIFEQHKAIVDKIRSSLNLSDYKCPPKKMFQALQRENIAIKINYSSFKLDDNIYRVFNDFGSLHTKCSHILTDCAKYLITSNEKSVFHGIQRPIDFDEIISYTDSSLRPYQVNNKRQIYQLWTECNSVMLQMPTGTGKTRLFVSIVHDIQRWADEVGQEVNILLLAHRKELIEQISHNVGVTYHIPHGLIVAASNEQRMYNVQVGSIPTLSRRLDNWKDKNFDIIIVDEAHHVKASSYVKILKTFPTAKVLGVTATPCRLNGASFRPEFDEIIVSPSVSKFIKEGYLCDYDYYSIKPESHVSKEIAGIKNFALDGDYLDSAMMEVMDTVTIRANIIQTYLKYAKGKKGIVYTINRVHNEHICERFKAAGVKAAAIDSKTPEKERTDIVEDFRKGRIDVLCNVNIFSEGFDCPDVEFIQLARPTKSLSLYLQQVGRGLRTAEDKEKVIFLDNVGLYNRFGFPSARRQWRRHFEGRYQREEDEYEKNFSADDIDGKELTYIDESQLFEEGQESVDLLHTSKIEDPFQIDEYGYIKNFDAYIEKKLSDNKALVIQLSVLMDNLQQLEKESTVFKKYKVPVPDDVRVRLEKLRADIDILSQKKEIVDEFKSIAWKNATKDLAKQFQSRDFINVILSLKNKGYKIHIKGNKDEVPQVILEKES